MTTPEISARLVELCASGDFDTALKELYAEDAISIEPQATPEFAKETKGLDALIKKGEKFTHLTEELHNVTVSNPLVTGNIIAFVLTMDITMKGKKRMSIGELCVYQVKDGKIISEQFFM
ncbi:nuclear transport factor 2 family protein [Terrimonas sp. NA20]|uniref:Nuclear transport factor 2 family protein n=1 Tax=Terrimonas ginsenosidimutans TaxID=2908004 RepID=A0ABS9KMM6_9BACT|nr:nuclear transport factor 2 family protein [Terrimonas ginsenosidimutans]MCG2613582.1 nuclear transport factor 2 family protein [Terrimonas ginsenosidimutans]